ncbi:MAG: gliding motility-associated C-terminal domain-containing protein [Flavobacteriales bacterium]|jgi:hypothetical protein
MKKISLLFAAIIAAVGGFAQITANGFSSRSLTAYTNGATNDSIYFYCTGELGSLTATPTGGVAPYDFNWQQYSTASNAYVAYQTQNDLLVATLNDLPAGGYRVTITDANGTIVGCDRAWISEVLTNPSVNVNPITPGCGSVSLNGQVTYATATPYYNPPPDPMIVGANTQITVCFSGTHTFVSDIGFYFVGPASCGSPTITLSPNPGTNCNAGDNINNLCFTNVQSFPNFNVCGAAVPLTGTYDSYGAANTPINWTALNGCNAASSGWRVQIYDCVGADVGALTDATITFVGQDGCGQPQTITYTTPAGFNSPIADNSCSASTASVFQVPTGSTTPIAFQNGYQWSANPTITIPNATSSLTPTVNPGPTQNTTFTLTITGNGPGAACGGTISDSELREYVVPANPTIDPVEPFYCIGDPIFTLSANPSGGSWSGPGIVNAITGAFNTNSAGGPGLKTITYTINLSGCIITQQIQINLLPTVNSTITNPGIICGSNEIVDLNAASAGGTWSGTGITDANQGLFDPTVAGIGTFPITYTIPNACNGTSTIDVVVAEPGEASINEPTQICTGGGIVTLTGNPGGGTWSGPGIVDANAGSFDPTVTGPGTFEVTYSFDDCITPATYTIEVTESIVLELSPILPLCEDAAPITLAASNGGGTWSGPGITNAIAGIFDPSVAGPGTHEVTYSVPNTCDGVSSITIEVLPVFELSIVDPGAQCITAPGFNMQGSPSGGVWTGNGITNGASGFFNPAVAGIGTSVVTYEVPNSCSTPVTVSIEVTEFVDATITDVNPICVTSEPIQLVAATPGGVWSGTGVNSLGLFTPSIVGAGNAQITYSINDVCTGQDQVTIQIVPLPDIVFNTPAQICIDAPTVLLNATPIGGLWTGNGVVFAGFTPADAGVGPHTLTYTVVGVCTASEEVSINVNPLPTVVASADQAICAGATTTISASGAASYLWSPGGSSPTNAFNNVTPSNTTTYTVTGTSAAGCESTDQVVVTVNPLPTVTATAASTNICEGETVQLFGSGLTTYQWTPATILNDDNIANPVASPFNTQTYTVSGTDANGCAGTASVTVNMTILDFEITSVPPMDAQNVINGQLPVTVQFSTISNADEFSWDFDGDDEFDLVTPTNQAQNTFYNEGGSSGYVIAELNGCTDTITFTVVAFTNAFIKIPNVISANGDGMNDSFKVEGNFIASFELNLYNRNGTFIVSMDDLDEIWDFQDSFDTWSPRGEFNDGTYLYYYIAKGLDGQEFKGSGTLTVLGNE